MSWCQYFGQPWNNWVINQKIYFVKWNGELLFQQSNNINLIWKLTFLSKNHHDLKALATFYYQVLSSTYFLCYSSSDFIISAGSILLFCLIRLGCLCQDPGSHFINMWGNTHGSLTGSDWSRDWIKCSDWSINISSVFWLVAWERHLHCHWHWHHNCHLPDQRQLISKYWVKIKISQELSELKRPFNRKLWQYENEEIGYFCLLSTWFCNFLLCFNVVSMSCVVVALLSQSKSKVQKLKFKSKVQVKFKV